MLSRSSASWMRRCTYGLMVATVAAPPALAALALDFAISTSLRSVAVLPGTYPKSRRSPRPPGRLERELEDLVHVTHEAEVDPGAQVLGHVLGVDLVLGGRDHAA